MQFKSITLYFLIGAIALWASINFADENRYTAGSLPGNFEVVSTGAASYTIPISVPPGTSNLEPSLYISYLSQRGNGLLGMGFALDGLTAITRCPSNIYQNGVIRGVDFSNQDRFCLNGEQLIAIDGEYGANNTSYRLYSASNTKVISYGNLSSGPKNFQVWTPNGKIAEYGMSEDARISARGKNIISMWALNRISDTLGNYLTIQYEQDPPNGMLYPIKISYTGNTNAKITPYNEIRFLYKNRPDRIESFHAGSITSINKLLSEIQIFCEKELIFRYLLTYELSPNTHKSRLLSIKKCTKNNVCFPPTRFTWQTNDNPGWREAFDHAPPTPTFTDQQNRGVRFLNLDNSGLLGIVQNFRHENHAISANAWLNTDGSWKSFPNLTPPTPIKAYEKETGLEFIDLNGDGLPDIVQHRLFDINKKNSGAWINTGDTWKDTPAYIPPTPIIDNGEDTGVRFIDLNGDGLPDIVQHRQYDPHKKDQSTWINTGSGWQNTNNYLLPIPITDNGKDAGTRFIDLNGDGLIDVVQHRTYENGQKDLSAWINTGVSWQSAPNYIPPVPITDQGEDAGVRFIDLNGDGLLDIVQHRLYGDNKISAGAWINTGDGWQSAPNYIPPIPITDHGKDNGARFVDLNGDGILDLVQNRQEDYGSSSGAWINTGNGWLSAPNYIPPIPIFAYGKSTGTNFIDLNGKGFPDLVINDGKRYQGAFLNTAQKPDLLNSITNGLETKLDIRYSFLPNKEIYTKDSTIYPSYEPQFPLYVVAKTNSNAGDNHYNHITKYTYQGAKMHHLGLGFLGFRAIKVKDDKKGITVTTTYSQNYDNHLIGQILKTETSLSSGIIISSTENSWTNKILGDGSINHTCYSPYIKKIVNKAFTLRGDLISSKTYDLEVDDFLNPINIKISIENSNKTYTTTTQNTYQNDTNSWLLGMLTRASVTAMSSNTAPVTRTSSYEYDSKTGLLTKTTLEPDDPQYTVNTSYNHDTFGNVIKTTITGPNIETRTSTQEHDSYGRFVIKNINFLGHITSSTVDPRFGKSTKTLDANNVSLIYKIDDFGRIVALDHAAGEKTNISYDFAPTLQNASYKIMHKIVNGITEINYYDHLNHEIAKTTQGLNGQIIWQTNFYDDLGRISKRSTPYFDGETPHYTEYKYDILDRIVRIIHPDNTKTIISYDGLSTTVTNALGQKATKITDARGNLLEGINNFGKGVYYQYDAFGNLTQTKDSSNNVTSFKYDKLGRRVELDDCDKGHWTYRYNALNELLSETDAMGQTTSFQYDRLGRMIKRTDHAGTSTWTYDSALHGIGKIAHIESVTNLKGQTGNGAEIARAINEALLNEKRTYFYDSLSRIAKTILTINGNDYIHTIDYDDSSRPKIETFPSKLAIENHYNDLGFLVKIDNAANGERYWQLNSLDAMGHITSETHHNGLTTNYRYDPKTQYLTHIKTDKIQDLHYSYDYLGNIKNRNDLINNISEKFEYDGLTRLIKSSDAMGKIISWQYNDIGNITYKSDLGYYFYGERGAGPHAVTSISGEKKTQFSYNPNGDQIEAIINGTPRIIHYTSYSKPYFISGPQGVSVFYYNADREHFARVDQSDGKVMTAFYLGNFELLTVKNKNSYFFEEKHYIGPSTLYVHHEDEKGKNNKTYTLLHDRFNSLTDITDSDAHSIAHFYYSPFGERVISDAQKNNALSRKGFANHETIDLFNLIHMSGRIYDPHIGRFLSADPTVQNPEDLQSLNRYSYCINNPLRYIDPDGYNFFDDVIRGFGHIIHDIGVGVGKVFQSHNIEKLLLISCSILSGNAAWYIMPLASSSLTAISGGDFSNIMKSAAIAFAEVEIWSIDYNIAKSINHAGNWSGFISKSEDILIHGSLGGGLSTMSGGNFQDGFISGAVTEAASGWINQIEKDSMYEKAIMKRGIAAGIVGGTASTLSGGNFINGAETAAFCRMFSEETALFLNLHSMQFQTQKDLEEAMGPSAVAFADIALDAMPHHLMIRDWFLHDTHLALAHKEVFFTDAGGHLAHLGFNGFGSGLHPDERFNANNLKAYNFGPISNNVDVNNSVLYQSKFLNPKSYNLFLHNCQYYGDTVRRSLHLPKEAF